SRVGRFRGVVRYPSPVRPGRPPAKTAYGDARCAGCEPGTGGRSARPGRGIGGRVPARSDGASAAVAPAAGGGPPVPVAARSGGARGRRLRAPAVAGVATGAQERRRARRASVAHRGGPYRGIRDTGNGLGGIRGASGGAGGERGGGGRGGGASGRRGRAGAGEGRARRG